jgi:hypothetical protein
MKFFFKPISSQVFNRFLYTIFKFGWLAIFSIYIGFLYGYGSNVSLLMLLPLQVLLAADFGLSVVSASTDRRPSGAIVLMFSIISTAINFYIFFDILAGLYSWYGLVFVLSGILFFSISIIKINVFDSLARNKGEVSTLTKSNYWVLFFIIISIWIMSTFEPRCILFLIFGYFVYFSCLGRGYKYLSIYSIRDNYSKILFFSVGVIMMYSGTRFDLIANSNSLNQMHGYLDLFEKVFVIFIFPLNILLNVFHARKQDIRSLGWMVSLFVVFIIVIFNAWLFSSPVLFLVAVFYLKLVVSVFMFYENYFGDVKKFTSIIIVVLVTTLLMIKMLFFENVFYDLITTVLMLIFVYVILLSQYINGFSSKGAGR